MSKTRIPPEIEEALWTVAESNDPRAVEEFGARYPAFRQELVQRIQMVRRLRASRPSSEAPAMRFRPAPMRASRRWPAFALGGLLFASLAWGAVSITSGGRATTHRPQTEEAVTALQDTAPERGRTSGLSLAPGDKTQQAVPDAPQTKVQEVPEAPAADPFERPVSVDFERTRLTAVLREIGRQAKLRLEIAPGLEDIEVQARYAHMSAKEALRDLGDNFGFTVVVQEGEHALVIPALDDRERPTGGSVPPGAGSGPATKLVPNSPNGG